MTNRQLQDKVEELRRRITEEPRHEWRLHEWLEEAVDLLSWTITKLPPDHAQ